MLAQELRFGIHRRIDLESRRDSGLGPFRLSRSWPEAENMKKHERGISGTGGAAAAVFCAVRTASVVAHRRLANSVRLAASAVHFQLRGCRLDKHLTSVSIREPDGGNTLFSIFQKLPRSGSHGHLCIHYPAILSRVNTACKPRCRVLVCEIPAWLLPLVTVLVRAAVLVFPGREAKA